MKKLTDVIIEEAGMLFLAGLLFMIIAIATSCKEEVPLTEINGCQSGYNTSNQLVFIRCRTRGEAQADGQNVSVYNGANSNPQFTIYKNVKWEACSQCK